MSLSTPPSTRSRRLENQAEAQTLAAARRARPAPALEGLPKYRLEAEPTASKATSPWRRAARVLGKDTLIKERPTDPVRRPGDPPLWSRLDGAAAVSTEQIVEPATDGCPWSKDEPGRTTTSSAASEEQRAAAWGRAPPKAWEPPTGRYATLWLPQKGLAAVFWTHTPHGLDRYSWHAGARLPPQATEGELLVQKLKSLPREWQPYGAALYSPREPPAEDERVTNAEPPPPSAARSEAAPLRKLELPPLIEMLAGMSLREAVK
jgi:hypothetical protein